ncbi:MAG: HAD-IB family hydrolase [Proteobacteria bacterium]|nr:MAG: HAD-IB family hydrolase [Pseudomonadota bacterium]
MHLVLFDMDHTLIPADSGTLWAQFLYEQGRLSDEQMATREKFLHQYNAGTLKVEDAYSFDIGVLSSLGEDAPELLTEYFQHRVLPIISQAARDKVQFHLDAGHYVVMITATLEEMARPVAEFFGMHHLIGGKAKRDASGNYTGELEDLGPCMGRGKLVHLEDWLTTSGNNPSEYTFYSDSHNDLPLLEQVDTPIAVDPDDSLRAIAVENNWQIISFY